MNRVILMLFMVLVSNTAMARWVYVNSTDDGSRYYFDMSTMRKNENTVKIWLLSDHKQAKQGDLSSKLLIEYDCKEGVSRAISGTYYTQNMGSGNVTTSVSKTTDWLPLTPETVGETHWQYACGKKEISEAALLDGSLNNWTLIDMGTEFNTYAEIPKLAASKNKKKTVKASGSKLSTVKMWVLWDFKEIVADKVDNSYKYLSEKNLMEFNCNEDNARFLKFAHYSENMGVGNVMWSGDNDTKPDVNWKPITPDSINSVLKQKACGQ